MEAPAERLDSAVEFDLSFLECLASQERSLRSGRAGVHVATLGETAVSYGVGVPETSPYLERARGDGVPVVRRPSGGTGLVHLRGDLVWAVILPRSDRRAGRDFVRAYGRLGRGLVSYLGARGHPSDWVAPPGRSEAYCPLGTRGQVLESGGRVLAAAAQHVTGSTLLHHGVLPRTLDRARIARWFDLPQPGPADSLTSLVELGVDDSPQEVARALTDHLVASLETDEPE